MPKPTREEMIAKLQKKAGGMARPSFGGDRFKPDDGRHFLRILAGYDYKVCDDGPSFELFQHWFKIDGKTRPFYCGSRTMMGDEHDNTKCRLCQTWELLGSMSEEVPDTKENKDLRDIIDMTRKKFSFRSSSVMNIVLRGKGDKADKALIWGCPPTVAQTVLNTVADNMAEDDEFDPFDEEIGWDWILTRTTEKQNTSYTIALKTKPSPIGEFEGEITNLDTMYENEMKQSANERNTTAIDELITNLLDPIFERADEEGIDFTSFRNDAVSRGKPASKQDPVRAKHKPIADNSPEKPKPKPKSTTAVGNELPAKKIEHELLKEDDPDDADSSEMNAAQEAIASANAMFNQDDDDDDDEG